MEYRRLGNTGLKLSVLSFGTWITFVNQLNEAEARELVAHAHGEGVNFFDTAEGYMDGEAEAMLGSALAKLALVRDSYCVSSKVFWCGDFPTQKGLSRKHVVEACHSALKRLQVDYLDIYYCHRPDPETPIFETVRAMHDLICQGKVLYWGTSEWHPWQIRKAISLARRHGLYGPVVEQPEYNLLCRHKVELKLKSLVSRHGLGMTTWSPLASGLLTGKYNQGVPPSSRLSIEGNEWLRQQKLSSEAEVHLNKVRALSEVANQLGCSMAQLSIAWCVNNPAVTSVILGASTLEQLKQNIAATALLPRFEPGVIDQINTITQATFLSNLKTRAEIFRADLGARRRQA